MLEYSRNLKEPSRELRKEMTDAEQKLWLHLHRKQILGIQFYRQKPLGSYIVDFYAPAVKLVIELDGSQHHEPDYLKKDAERDLFLADHGLLVLRYDNRQVLLETYAVIEEIERVCSERQIPPSPPLSKGGDYFSSSVEQGENPPSLSKREDEVIQQHAPPLAKGDSGGFKETEGLDPIAISALEHYAYCPRQCALIHVEQVWSENLYTMRGQDVHERVHDDSSHELAGVRLERSLPVWSRALNLTGKADLVEFHGHQPYPVEYKSGRRKRGVPEIIQLCAQAICLEEMFGVAVPKGALFWHGSRERQEVVFTDSMREQVKQVTQAVREMLEQRITPPPVNDKRCENCSLKESCMPAIVADKGRSRKAARELFQVEGVR